MEARPEDVLAGVPGQTGTLVLNLDGTVVSATGDLKSDQKAAGTIYQMLLDANQVITSGTASSPFRKMTISFQQHAIIVTIHNDKICAVKRTI